VAVDDHAPEPSISEKWRFMAEIIKSTDTLPVSAPLTTTIDVQILYFLESG